MVQHRTLHGELGNVTPDEADADHYAANPDPRGLRTPTRKASVKPRPNQLDDPVTLGDQCPVLQGNHRLQTVHRRLEPSDYRLELAKPGGQIVHPTSLSAIARQWRTLTQRATGFPLTNYHQDSCRWVRSTHGDHPVIASRRRQKVQFPSSQKSVQRISLRPR